MLGWSKVEGCGGGEGTWTEKEEKGEIDGEGGEGGEAGFWVSGWMGELLS
jgi:hypothetical protein